MYIAALPIGGMFVCRGIQGDRGASILLCIPALTKRYAPGKLVRDLEYIH